VRVQYKLFAITLFASLILVTAMLLLAQWSFDRGLLEHVNKRAVQQYNSLSESLESHYQQYGHWQALIASHYSWLQLQQNAGIDIDPRALQRTQNEGRDSAQRSRRPVKEHFSQDRLSENKPPHHKRPKHPNNRDQNDRPLNRPPLNREPRDEGPEHKQPLALLNVNKERIVGFLVICRRQYTHRLYCVC
jgi:hypothetical protein